MTGYVEGKVAIVTGAGRGIGRAIAMLMAKEGASVVVVDLGAALDGSGSDQGPAQETVNDIKQAGGKAIASTLSITEPQNAEAIVKAAIDAFGRVDILVNNAGILRDRIFHRMSWSDWHDVINVHLNGSFNMARAVADHFRDQNSGAMVHMTSTSGLIGNFGQANYMAAKLGIHGLVARHRARHGALQCALELHLAVRLEPHDRLDPDRDRAGEAARRAPEADDARQDRAARGLSLLRQGRGHQRADHRRAQQRDLPLLAAAPDPRAAPLGRLDVEKARRAAQEDAFKQSFTPLERSGDVLNLGSGCEWRSSTTS